MTRPAGKSTGATSAMGLARFLPLVLAELTEVAPSSMSMSTPAPAARAGAQASRGPAGAGAAAGGEGPAVAGGGGAEEIRLEERAEREGSEAETLEEGAAWQVGIHGWS